MESEKKTIETMSNVEALDVLWQALNKSTLKGTFNINEAHLLKLVHDKLYIVFTPDIAKSNN